MKRNLCSLLVLLVLPSISFASLVYNPTTGHWYERVDTDATWVEAKAAAEARTYAGMHGYLATITSEAEYQWIVANLGGALTLDHWLGGYRDLDSGSEFTGWHWVTGETWSYTKWFPGEPSSIYENALQFDDDERINPLLGYWNDLDRNNPELGYIVEYSHPVPIPGAVWLLGSGLMGLIGLKSIKHRQPHHSRR
jgi:hypothetical protein